ncbi:MAG: hypothetical protein J7494_01205 [Sphingobium sp.]|nr:hypothetical protein [Sphingobium sp.]
MALGTASARGSEVPLGSDSQAAASTLKVELKVLFLPSESVERGNNKYQIDDSSPPPAKIRNRLFAVTFLLAGCQPASDGNCNVTVEYRMIDPTGKPAFVSARREAWMGAPIVGDLKPGIDGVEAGFDSTDPPGDYRIVITLFDNVANSRVSAERTLHLERVD